MPIDDQSTTHLRRKIPPVSEVFEKLYRIFKRGEFSQGQIFEAAQRACTDELKRLRYEGGDAASCEVLINRAHRLLDPTVSLLPMQTGAIRVSAPAAARIVPATQDGPFELSEPLRPSRSVRVDSTGPFSLTDDPASIEKDMTVLSDPLRPRPPKTEAQRPAPQRASVSIGPPPAPIPAPVELPAALEQAEPPRRGGRLAVAAVLLLVMGVGAGILYLRSTEKTGVRPSDSAPRRAPLHKSIASPATSTAPPQSKAPAAPAAFEPAAVTSSSAAAKTSASAPTSSPRTPPPARETFTSSAAATKIPESRGNEMISPDWARKSAVFVVHFSSYQSRSNAERDAQRLGAKLGRPARCVSVSLGAKGIWYRVVVGEFAAAADAQKYRDALAASGTPDVGHVYRLSAP